MGGAVSRKTPVRKPTIRSGIRDSNELLLEYHQLKNSGDDNSDIYRSLRSACSSVRLHDETAVNNAPVSVKNLALQRLAQTLCTESKQYRHLTDTQESNLTMSECSDKIRPITALDEYTNPDWKKGSISRRGPRRRPRPNLVVDTDYVVNDNPFNKLTVSPVVSSNVSPSGCLYVGEFVINQRIMTESSEFVEIKCLGSGTTCRVIEALHIPSMTVVALKMLQVNDDDDVKRVSSELSVLYECMAELKLLHDELDINPDKMDISDEGLNSNEERCRNVLGMYDAFVSSDTGMVNIVMEYMDGGSLQDVVERGGCNDESVVAQIAKQVLDGLMFLHNKKQLHRDIKPGNILINCNGDVRIADFGLAKVASVRNCHQNSFVGTLSYMSPERITSAPYSFPADVWSLGISLIAILSGEHPYGRCGNNFWELMKEICDEDSPTVSDEYSSKLKDFLRMCLMKEPSERATVNELLEHPFLSTALDHTPLTLEKFSSQSSYDFMDELSPTEPVLGNLIDLAVQKIHMSSSSTMSSPSVAQLASQAIAQCKSNTDESDNEQIAAMLVAARLEHMEVILGKIVAKYRSVEELRKTLSRQEFNNAVSSFEESSMRSVSRRKECSFLSVHVENMKKIPNPYTNGKRIWKRFADQLHIPLEIALLSAKTIMGDSFFAD